MLFRLNALCIIDCLFLLSIGLLELFLGMFELKLGILALEVKFTALLLCVKYNLLVLLASLE